MSLLWLRVAVFLYGVAALAVLPVALYDRPRWRHIAVPAAVAAVFFHFVSLAEMLNAADQIALKSLLFGLPCMTAGLLIGSLIAQATVGASYFRDPKILLAFAMWLAYVAMIYIRRHSGLRGRRAIYLSSFVFLVVLTVWASNQFSSVPR